MDLRLLAQMRTTRLDQIPPDQAAKVVREVVKQKAKTSVEVARFGSAI